MAFDRPIDGVETGAATAIRCCVRNPVNSRSSLDGFSNVLPGCQVDGDD